MTMIERRVTVVDVREYLRPIDVSSLPRHRGRKASRFYPDLVDAFMSSGESAMEVDVAKIGRKPATVRSALAGAIKGRGLQDGVRVSTNGEVVILLLR